MAEPTAFAISRLLSDLTGQEVSASLVLKPSPSKLPQIYGIYSTAVTGDPMLVRADLRLLAMLGGALVGFPAETAIAHAEEKPMAESIRDAIHEVLNIASTFLSTNTRVVFKSMTLEPQFSESAVGELLANPLFKSAFNLSVGKQPAGLLTVMSN